MENCTLAPFSTQIPVDLLLLCLEVLDFLRAWACELKCLRADGLDLWQGGCGKKMLGAEGPRRVWILTPLVSESDRLPYLVTCGEGIQVREPPRGVPCQL